MTKLKFWFIALLCLVVLGWGTIVEASVFHFSGTRPTNLGITNGKLLGCPPSPNCVSSQSDDFHQIEPLHYTTDRGTALDKLTAVIKSLPNTEIITTKDDYIYSEFTSAFMGYVDDVEFYAPIDRKTIEVRSASRLGESDLGVNRQRIETIRALFE